MDVDNTPVLADPEFRKAIALGTNIEDLAIVGYGALGKLPIGMFSPDSQFASEGYTFEYNPEEAKKVEEKVQQEIDLLLEQ